MSFCRKCSGFKQKSISEFEKSTRLSFKQKYCTAFFACIQMTSLYEVFSSLTNWLCPETIANSYWHRIHFSLIYLLRKSLSLQISIHKYVVTILELWIYLFTKKQATFFLVLCPPIFIDSHLRVWKCWTALLGGLQYWHEFLKLLL